jgi:hypothetical protein
LPHKAFALQSRHNHGLLNLASTSFTPSDASATFANAPPGTRANVLCRLSSEAVLLTGNINQYFVKTMVGGPYFTINKTTNTKKNFL